MDVDKFYDYITQHMTPEQALKKLLAGSLIHYEQLKFDEQHNAIHPLLVISMAAMDMGWNMMVENRGDEEVRGIAVGTSEYLATLNKKDDKEGTPV